MKKIIVSLLVTVSFVFATNMSGQTVDALVKKLTKEVQAYEHQNAMKTADVLIKRLMKNEKYKSAFQIARVFSRATSPVWSKFGMYKESNIYYEVYKKKKIKPLLLLAGAKLYGVSQSKEAAFILSTYAKEYGMDFKAFMKLVTKKAEENRVQKVLLSAMAHLKNGRWTLGSQYITAGILPVNSQKFTTGSALLHMAVWYNNMDAVKALVEKHSANINLKDKEGDSPLKYARHKKFKNIEAYLLKHGAK